MLQQKRIRKPTQPFAYQYNFLEKKAKNPNRKRKLKRCVYRLIPPNLKYAFSSKIYCLYADIPIILLEHERNVFYEFSLLNRFMRVEEIKIVSTFGEKLVKIKLDKKKDVKTSPWGQIIEKMEVSECKSLAEWAKFIKDFSEKYEQSISNSNHTAIDHLNIENQFQNQTECNNNQKMKLFESYPCLYLKSSLRDGGPGISEIIFNQSMISELGFQFDTFTNTIFQEGVPQIFPFNEEANTTILKLYLENYTNNKIENCASRELSSSLMLKDGTTRDVNLQVKFFPSDSTMEIGVDMMITVVDIKSICKKKRKAPRSKINQTFVEKTKNNQQEKDFFISSYYAEFIPLYYIFPDKVCKIKEIYVPPEENYYEEAQISKLEHTEF